jgi:4-hydroxy-tetrahydrodipicolinate reductase
MIRATVCGASGKMGANIISLAKNDPAIKIIGAIEQAGSPFIGKGEPPVSADLSAVIKDSDVVIDFTAPPATMKNIEVCLAAGKPIVIGPTGFDQAQLDKIRSIAKKIPVLLSPNMSVGVNVLFAIASRVSKLLPDFDVEITEVHHNQKKDAPSGTALKLAQIIAEALGRDLNASGVYGRKGNIGARKKDEIGIMSIRAGDTVGEHTVFFAGPGERVELTHRATSRDCLAKGALVAAKWLAAQKPGFYGMNDALGIG